jgi:Sec-independent protein translocase protein TatA
MDFGFSGEMIFLALLGLILFGPRKLPEIARTVGRFMTDLKRASSEFHGQLNREVQSLEPLDPKKNDPSKNFLTSLVDDFKALNSATEPAEANMARPEPAQPQQEISGASLIDNVNRIKELLAKNASVAETPD